MRTIERKSSRGSSGASVVIPEDRRSERSRCALAVLVLAALLVGASPASADQVTLVTMGLTGGPLALPLGHVLLAPGYGDVLSTVTLSLSPSQTSSGTPGSFFDIFFDITIKDSDPGLSFTNGAGRLILPSPEAFHFVYNGQVYMSSNGVKYALGYDVNQNGSLDRLAITSLIFTLSPTSGATLDSTALTSMVMLGNVSDVVTDPPFGPFTLTGPTTGTSSLAPPLPEPGTLSLLSLGLAATWWARRRSRS